MKPGLKFLLAPLLAATFSFGSIATTFASTSAANIQPRLAVQTSIDTQASVIDVRGHRDRYRPNHNYRPGPNYRPGHNYRPHRPGYYNGYQGYRNHRSGYRRHNDGWWYPLAAFMAGAVTGSAINQPQQGRPGVVVRLPQAHYNWCNAKYRSYRASDNSFQPYNGPRRACVSPYYR